MDKYEVNPTVVEVKCETCGRDVVNATRCSYCVALDDALGIPPRTLVDFQGGKDTVGGFPLNPLADPVPVNPVHDEYWAEQKLTASEAAIVNTLPLPKPQGVHRYVTGTMEGFVLAAVTFMSVGMVAEVFMLKMLKDPVKYASQLEGAQKLGWGLMALQVISFILAVIVFALWLQEASKRVPLLRGKTTYPPVLALWCWVIPVYNILLPGRVIQDVREQSESQMPKDVKKGKRRAYTLRARVLTPLLLVGSLLVLMAGAMAPLGEVMNGVEYNTGVKALSVLLAGQSILMLTLLTLSRIGFDITNQQYVRASNIRLLGEDWNQVKVWKGHRLGE